MRESTERALRWFLQKKLAEEKFRLSTSYTKHLTEKMREPTDQELSYYKSKVDDLLNALDEEE